MEKISEYDPPQSPPKEDLGDHIEKQLKHLTTKGEDAKRLVDFFVLLLILVLLLIIAF